MKELGKVGKRGRAGVHLKRANVRADSCRAREAGQDEGSQWNSRCKPGAMAPICAHLCTSVISAFGRLRLEGGELRPALGCRANLTQKWGRQANVRTLREHCLSHWRN